MKSVLCFGDSNTYGFNPKNGSRYNSEIRWSSVLKFALCNRFDVIEQGCNNRTAFSTNPDGIKYTGIDVLPKYLTSNIDFLVLNIGVNDLQIQYRNNVDSLESGITHLIEKAYELNPKIKILLLSPPKIKNNILHSLFSPMFDKNSVELSCKLYPIFKRIGEKYNCDLINLDEVVKVSDIDGLHYDEDGHRTLANVLIDYFVNLT